MNYPENNAQALDSLRWYAQMGVDLCVEGVPQKIVASRQSPVASATSAVAPSPLAGEGWDGGATNKTPTASPLTQPSPARGEGLIAAPLSPPASIASAIAEARALADAANDLTQLEAAVRGFTGCSLKKTATNTVFAGGVAQSRLMFIGDAPGAEEDRAGVPFSGPSGQLLDTMLGFIGLNRA
ncbi:MAG: hypothetical protein K2X09_05990, partial [Rickettsiales bacterium]|nr:hypothetical protein [Rickettsiales bacterium]